VATKSFTAAGLQSDQSSTAPDPNPKYAPNLANASAIILQDMGIYSTFADTNSEYNKHLMSRKMIAFTAISNDEEVSAEFKLEASVSIFTLESQHP